MATLHKEEPFGAQPHHVASRATQKARIALQQFEKEARKRKRKDREQMRNAGAYVDEGDTSNTSVAPEQGVRRDRGAAPDLTIRQPDGGVYLATQRHLHFRMGGGAGASGEQGPDGAAGEPAGRDSHGDPLGSVWSRMYPGAMLVHPAWPDARKRVREQLGVVSIASTVLFAACLLSAIALTGEVWMAVAVTLQGGSASNAVARGLRWFASGSTGEGLDLGGLSQVLGDTDGSYSSGAAGDLTAAHIAAMAAGIGASGNPAVLVPAATVGTDAEAWVAHWRNRSVGQLASPEHGFTSSLALPRMSDSLSRGFSDVPPALVARTAVGTDGAASSKAAHFLAARASAGARWYAGQASEGAEDSGADAAFGRYAGNCGHSALRWGGIGVPVDGNTCNSFGGRGTVTNFFGSVEGRQDEALARLASLSGPGGSTYSGDVAVGLAGVAFNSSTHDLWSGTESASPSGLD